MKRIAKFIRRKVAALRKPQAAFSPRLVLFDFDGTLADTFMLGAELFNQCATQFGYKAARVDQITAIRNMSAMQFLKNFDFPILKLPQIAKVMTSGMNKRIGEVACFPGLPEALRELKASGFSLGIVTSNTEVNVRAFLARHDLEIFDTVSACSKLLGKARALRKTCQAAGYERHEVIYIGDEMRDIEASKKAGLRVAAVAWGYNTTASLATLAPDYVFTTPADIPKILIPLFSHQPINS